MEYLSVEIDKNWHYIGVNDRDTRLFENMWPLENGVSYNSYLYTGEKTALLDTVKINKSGLFVEKLEAALKGRPIDYLIVHHMEPDHSGSITSVLDLYPDIKLVGNKKTREFLENYYQLEGYNGFSYEKNFVEVGDGDKLSLGDTELTFYLTPMVHWPESMVSFEESTGRLFSQDAFGAFGSLSGAIFDDEINWEFYLDDTIRYYTNIIGKFSTLVKNALKKLSPLDIKMICPVHGPVWRTNPSRIFDLYQKLSDQKTEEGVAIIYGSMYGNTEKMAETIARTLAVRGIKNVRIFDVSKTHLSYLLADMWRYEGLVLGSCTYNNALFPPMENLVRTLVNQKMKNHTLGVFGSYSWGGGALKELQEFANKSGYDLVESTVEVKGTPNKEDFEKGVALGNEMADKIIAKRSQDYYVEF
ncbi:FprA family A-type flavoprotein [Neofamilia massiliensis]|uniref:FprA family A-type flavoprotein n=1 Tax=Neofamilia massiliensis TaxID=1673724 RepID=UPI0006BB6FB5|nr:FprA family A-type flavoprotein [Neofamilia massiliensis]